MVLLFFLQMTFPCFGTEISVQDYVKIALQHAKMQSQKDSLLSEFKSQIHLSKGWEPSEIQIGWGSFQTGPFSGPYSEFMISQKLPWSVQKLEISENFSNELLLKKANLKRRVIAQSFELYSVVQNFFHQTEHFQHLEERLKRLQKLKQSLVVRRAISPLDRLEKTILQMKIQSLELEMADIRANQETSRKRLKFLGGLSSTPVFTTDIPLREWTAVLKKEMEAQTELQKEVSAEEQIRKTKLSYSQMSWAPELSFYYYQNRQNADLLENTQAFGILVNLPLFGFQERVHAARSRLSAFESEKLMMESMLNQAFLSLNTQLESLERYDQTFGKKAIRDLEKELSLATKGFDLGQVQSPQLIDLEDRVHSVLKGRQDLESRLLESIFNLASLLNVDLNEQ